MFDFRNSLDLIRVVNEEERIYFIQFKFYLFFMNVDRIIYFIKWFCLVDENKEMCCM